MRRTSGRSSALYGGSSAFLGARRTRTATAGGVQRRTVREYSSGCYRRRWLAETATKDRPLYLKFWAEFGGSVAAALLVAPAGYTGRVLSAPAGHGVRRRRRCARHALLCRLIECAGGRAVLTVLRQTTLSPVGRVEGSR